MRNSRHIRWSTRRSLGWKSRAPPATTFNVVQKFHLSSETKVINGSHRDTSLYGFRFRSHTDVKDFPWISGTSTLGGGERSRRSSRALVPIDPVGLVFGTDQTILGFNLNITNLETIGQVNEQGQHGLEEVDFNGGIDTH